MIYLYSGTPGSGKSLHQARDIYYWLRLGKPVIANYKISTAKVRKKHPERLEFYYIDNVLTLHPQELKDFSREYFKTHKFREGTIRLYIDESQLLFNSRDYNRGDRMAWIEFFTQHRKYGYDIYLVAQFDRMLDRQIRALIEYEVIHRKVNNFGIFGKLFSLLSPKGLFVAVKLWYPLKQKTDSEFFSYSNRYGRLYDTFKDFNDGGMGDKSPISANTPPAGVQAVPEQVQVSAPLPSPLS